MNREKNENLYSSHDLGCATAISIFFPIWAIDRANPRKAEFMFKREQGLEKIVQDYWSNTLQVSPLAYFNQLKTIKSRLYEQK